MKHPFNLNHFFAQSMDDLCPGDAPLRLAVAVSGGADSLAATLLAGEWVRARGGTLLALTVDHGLRPESRPEAEAVHHLLGQMDIEHKILSWEGDKPISRLQERAREARLALLARECQNENIQHLILAHHKDDMHETCLMRLMRGSTLLGCAAMSAKRILGGVRLLRPLLGVPKSALTAHLEAKSVSWCEDPSNQKEIFTRVRMRQALAKGLELPMESLGRLGRVRALWERVTLKLFHEIGTLTPLGCAHLDIERFLRLPAPWQEAIMARLVPLIGARAYPVRREGLATILLKLKDRKTFTGGGCVFRTKGKTLWIMREPSGAKDTQDLKACLSFSWDRRFSYGGPPVSGCLKRLGDGGVLHLKRAGVSLPRLPREALESLPSLWQGETLLWAWGLLESAPLEAHVTCLVEGRWQEVFTPHLEQETFLLHGAPDPSPAGP